MTDDLRTSRTVLIADDEAPLRKALDAALTHAGYAVLEAGDGQSAVATAHAHHPDLIILDVFMPGMDGREALREIRAGEDTMHTPVIMLTNMNDMGYVAEVAAYSGVDYLVKSDWSLVDIVKKVGERLAPQV